MMIGNRKEGGRVFTVLLHVIRKIPTPSENRLAAILNINKPKSVLRLEFGLPRHNAIALPPTFPVYRSHNLTKYLDFKILRNRAETILFFENSACPHPHLTSDDPPSLFLNINEQHLRLS